MAQHYSEEMDDAATRPQDVDVPAQQSDAGEVRQDKGNDTPAKRTKSSGTRRRAKGNDTPLRALPKPSAEEIQRDEDLVELEAQGFTRDEAIRLMLTSDRLAHSNEVRDAEAAMRRLRFTRWLVERGVLDEFSA